MPLTVFAAPRAPTGVRGMVWSKRTRSNRIVFTLMGCSGLYVWMPTEINMADFKRVPSVNGVDVSLTTHTHTSSDVADATPSNVASTLVMRDASGNFSAGTITGSLTGTASNATQLDGHPAADFVLSGAVDFGTL